MERSHDEWWQSLYNFTYDPINASCLINFQVGSGSLNLGFTDFKIQFIKYLVFIIFNEVSEMLLQHCHVSCWYWGVQQSVWPIPLEGLWFLSSSLSLEYKFQNDFGSESHVIEFVPYVFFMIIFTRFYIFLVFFFQFVEFKYMIVIEGICPDDFCITLNFVL